MAFIGNIPLIISATHGITTPTVHYQATKFP